MTFDLLIPINLILLTNFQNRGGDRPIAWLRLLSTGCKRRTVNLTNFMYNEKKLYDNYVGQNIKNLRTFFNWLNNFLNIHTGYSYKRFYVRNEQIQILTLSQEQLKFLMFDLDFEQRISPALVKSKNIFVFGCLTGLRFSDLMKIKKNRHRISRWRHLYKNGFPKNYSTFGYKVSFSSFLFIGEIKDSR